MKMIDFSFIKESILRGNIERIYDDVFELHLLLSQGISIKVVDCLRKTIAIYTASIIEALTLWKIQEEIVTERVTLKNEWKYYDPKLIHKTDDYEIIWAKRSEEERRISKLDFNVILRIGKDKRIFANALLKDLDKVRKLRNEIHIDQLEDIVKTYPLANVEFVQEVLVKTIRIVR